jgi:3-oxoacyl-[acyl-carrier-protein] synthase II
MNPSTQPEVVVTGMGAVSPLGLDLATTWRALRSGADARGRIDLFDTEGCRCREGAQVPLPAAPRAERRWSRASRLAILAAREALLQAGLLDTAALAGMPICASTTGAAMEWGETFLREALAGKKLRQYVRMARYQPQQQVLDLQRALGLDGPMTILGNACASGANAVGHGYDLIRSGLADGVLAGGFEALSEFTFTGFDCLLTLSREACRPFDTRRDGLMLGEGAAFLVLESADQARARGAKILGRIRGYGHSIDGNHLTQPTPGGDALVAAMRAALADAALGPGEIAYVNAHGTGTVSNDAAEAAAYAEVFGAALPGVAVSSTKAAIGHALGAAGSLEAVFALCAAREGIAPPQVHTREALPEVAASIAGEERRWDPAAPVLSVNLGFGGSNAALVLSR